MAADDVAGAICRVSVGAPRDGIVEVAGPLWFRLDDLVRRVLSARNDPRHVVADPHARFFGAELYERTLLPADDAELRRPVSRTGSPKPLPGSAVALTGN